MLCILFGFWEWLKSCFIDPAIFWQMIGSIATFLAAVVALFKESLFDYFNPPRIKFKVSGPSFDNCNQYWHLDIFNTGTTVKNAAIYLCAYYKNKEVHQIYNQRLQWPYEKRDERNRFLSDVKKYIINQQRVDLFSTETNKFSIEAPITCLPYDSNSYQLPLQVAVKVIGENYESNLFWIELSKKGGNYQLKEIPSPLPD